MVPIDPIIKNALKDRMTGFVSQSGGLLDLSNDELEFSPVIRSSLVTSVLVHWVKTGMQQPPDKLAATLTDLTGRLSQLNLLI